MGKDSSIQWTDHTFNPWIGCVKVSEGCKHCYAETLNHRWGHNNWGPASTTDRRITSEANWKQPIKWNKAAAATGVRARVFCASMADVFEDHPQVVDARLRLFNLIGETPALDWLLLTKRPENITPLLMQIAHPPALPRNVWIGASVENQEQADKRIPELLKVPARVRFLSCEPLLGPVDLQDYIGCHMSDAPDGIHWVIAGGESGPGARPMHPSWARSLRDQCQAAGTAFHFKQHGEYMPIPYEQHAKDYAAAVNGDGPWHNEVLLAPDGTQLPNDSYPYPGREIVRKVGKHAAGRLLDGRTWDEFPA